MSIIVMRGTGPQWNPVRFTPEFCVELEHRNPTAYKTDVLGDFADGGDTVVFPSDYVTAAFAQVLPECDGIECFNTIGTLDMASGGSDAVAAGVWQTIRVPAQYPAEGCLHLGHRPAVNEFGVFLRMIPTVSKQFWNDQTKQWELREIEPEALAKTYLALQQVHVQEGGFWQKMRGDEVLAPICQMFRQARVRYVFADSRERLLAHSELDKVGIRLIDTNWTAESKSEAVTLLKRLMHRREVMLCPCERLRRELGTYVQKAVPSGYRYAARGRHHDDVVSLLLNAAMATIQGYLHGSELFNRGGRTETPR